MHYKRLRLSIFMLVFTIAFGTFGLHLTEGMSFFESFYMTIITISTVGFGELKPLSSLGRIITMVTIITGVAIGTYTFGMILKVFIEGELSKVFGRRKLEKSISALKGHYIICGFGRIGSVICQELRSEKIPFIVIELSPAKNNQLENEGYLYINMDATSEEALVKAGIATAKGIVTAVSSDANNVFIALTAKGLRPDIFVLSRSSDVNNEAKLIKAGASRVVSPYVLGGRRMAEVLKRPTVVDFIDIAMANSRIGLVMEEALVGPTSSLIGKNLIESNLRRDYGVIIVAIKKPAGQMVFNPQPMEKLEAGDVIVVLGKKEDVGRMNDVL